MHTAQIPYYMPSPNGNQPYVPEQYSLPSFHSLFDRVLQNQNSILENQRMILEDHKKLNQRLSKIEQTLLNTLSESNSENNSNEIDVEDHKEELKENSNSNWFEKNFEVIGFEYQLGKVVTGTKYEFKIPIIAKCGTKFIKIHLKWVGTERLNEITQREIDRIITQETGMFLKPFSSKIKKVYNFYEVIQNGGLNVIFIPGTTYVNLVIRLNLQMPSSLYTKSYICLALTNKITLKAKSILFDDMVFVSKLGKGEHTSSVWDFLMKYEDLFLNASWYSILQNHIIQVSKTEDSQEKQEGESTTSKRQREMPLTISRKKPRYMIHNTNSMGHQTPLDDEEEDASLSPELPEVPSKTPSGTNLTLSNVPTKKSKLQSNYDATEEDSTEEFLNEISNPLGWQLPPSEYKDFS